MTPRIVVGVDGSEDSRRALRWAIAEAHAHGADIEAVHAWQTPYLGAAPFTPEMTDPALFEEAARHLLERELDHADTTGLSAPITPRLMHGAPVEALTRAAAGADLIVVGSRGLGGFTGLLLGSVSQHVAHRAPCPVTIVPGDGSLAGDP